MPRKARVDGQRLPGVFRRGLEVAQAKMGDGQGEERHGGRPVQVEGSHEVADRLGVVVDGGEHETQADRQVSCLTDGEVVGPHGLDGGGDVAAPVCRRRGRQVEKRREPLQEDHAVPMG